MWIAIALALVAGYGLGKLDAIRRLRKLMLGMTPDQRETFKSLISE